jgi:hypothetical protein
MARRSVYATSRSASVVGDRRSPTPPIAARLVGEEEMTQRERDADAKNKRGKENIPRLFIAVRKTKSMVLI